MSNSLKDLPKIKALIKYHSEGKVWFEVGLNCDEIKGYDYCPEPYCERYLYEIHKNGKIIYELHDVSLVEYF